MPAAAAITRLSPSEQLAAAQRENNRLRKNLAVVENQNEAADNILTKYKAGMNELAARYQGAATYAIGGFGLGALLVYFFHDDVVDFFGKDSIIGHLVLPGAGLLAGYYSTKIKDPANKPGLHLEDRMGVLGIGAGLTIAGSYYSYTTWPQSS